MPSHGVYSTVRNGVTTRLRVTETIAGNGEGVIKAANNDDSFTGYLEYKFDYTIQNTTCLSVKNMLAKPRGRDVGTLLVWLAANAAVFKNCKMMGALAVAMPAQGFYYKCGFLPSLEELEIKRKVVEDSANSNDPLSYSDKQDLFESFAANWYRDTDVVLARTHNIIRTIWVPTYT
jgi:hypothetical protein